ncbi:deaminase domain-containing protein [Vibrio aerogenes]|uniref:deaminase domain-containing protein n=3 Tax=Vibrio aerogenes TaxID=92172 RepID=UPI0021C2DDD2|nr:deaminase domain-containing protein [Vibrio aerogenes]
MSKSNQQKQADILSSVEAAEQNFSTDKVLDCGCVKCGCELFIRYHYDDDQPIAGAEVVLTDSNKTEVSGTTDDNGLLKVKDMGCGGYDLMLGEGKDTFKPEDAMENNPVLQNNPKYAVLAGEYFALYATLNRAGYLEYDASDSSDDEIDIDRHWMKGSIPDEYAPAYDRFQELVKQINHGSVDLRKAVNKIHSSLAGEMAGLAHDNTAILLFCEVALGFVPVVGQAMDLYDLGCWGWDTCTKDELDFWHWAGGVLVVIGFIPGLGDATKKTGKTIIEALQKADSRVIQKAIKILRSLSNGNLVKYLKKFGSTLDEYAGKAKKLLQEIIAGLTDAVNKSNNWAVVLMKDAFMKLVEAMKKLENKIDEMTGKIKSKVDEFVDKVVTHKTGTPYKKKTMKDPVNTNAGKENYRKKDLEDAELKKTHEAQQAKDAETPTDKTKAKEKDPIVCKDDPVDVSTGQVFESRQDFVVAGFQPLIHSRYYHSVGRRETGLMGALWRSSWDISLEVNGTDVTFTDEDYTTAEFILPYQDLPTQSAEKPQYWLHRGNCGELILKHKDGQQYWFEHAIGSQLRLTRIRDAYGNENAFLYERGTLKWVMLSDERLVKVETERKRITCLTLCDKQKNPLRELARYTYDNKGWLMSVRGEPGRNFDYQYSPEGYLTRWQDLAKTWAEHDYDEQGRVTDNRCAEGYWSGQVRYDDEKRIHYHKSTFGGITEFHLNEAYRAEAIVDPEGHRSAQHWQGDKLVSETNPLGETNTYQYDEWGNVTSVTLPDGTAHTYTYNDKGWLTAYTNPAGAQWLYEHNKQGDVTKVTDPDGRQWLQTYTSRGLRDSVTGPDGSVTRWQYNDQGLPHRLEPATGYGMTFYYDVLDRLIKRESDNKQVRRWCYEGKQLTPSQIIYEDGTTARFSYDIEGNLTSVTDTLGHTRRFEYGAFDKLRAVTDPTGATTRYHYNVEAEFAGVTNSKGDQWLYEFDTLGRISSERHYDGRKEQFSYDPAGRMVKRTKPDGHHYHYQYDPCGRLLEAQSFDPHNNPTGKSWYEYDEAARLKYAENGDAWVEMQYSPAGLLLSENLNGTPITHEYDAAGRRTAMNGTQTTRAYQWQQQQLMQLHMGEHDPLKFAYHASGQESARTSEAGFGLFHDWSATGLLTHQRLGAGYAPAGRGTVLRQYQYDALDQLTAIEDKRRGHTEFTLNPNGQISAVRQRKSWETKASFVQLFGYDSELNLNETGTGSEYSGNVVSMADERLKRQTKQYDNAGRVVETGRFKYVYDECGRVTTKTESKDGFRPQTTKFIWNDEDRLTHIELPDGTRYRYRYDPFGRRIAKECLKTQTETHYLWDGNTVVQQSKMTADGTQLQSTEYLYEPDTFRPLAQITTDHDTGRERLHYIVTDHAGTPQELCTPDGEIQWQGDQHLWGKYQQQRTQVNRGYLEQVANDAITCDLRYQGQIEDRESGLYYNLNRYYDAESGQYLSPDPIGFAGGLRPQAYVDNPMEWADPLGLAKCPKGRAKQYRDSGNVGKKRNIATSDYEINGEKGMADAVSGKNTNDAPFVKIPDVDNRKFSTFEVGHDRAFDSEVKIFEHIASKYPTSATGKIDLYSELECCPSCSEVINQFKKMYPNIEVNVIWG